MGGLDGADIGPLLHLGYHKTASTLLQQHLFDLPACGFRRLRDDRRRIQPLFVRHGPFDPVSDADCAALRAEASAAAAEGCRLVISHERLSGYIASGGYDARAIADRLHGVFPRARVLIVVRAQRPMLRSYYLQYLTDGGPLSFDRLIHDPQPNQRRIPQFRFEYFAYDALVAYYQLLFGRDAVLVLPFEMLVKTPADFLQRVIGFAGRAGAAPPTLPNAVNAAHPFALQALRRHLNRVCADTHLSRGGLIQGAGFGVGFDRLAPLFAPLRVFDAPLKRRLDAQIARAVVGRYGASNTRLAAISGLDLARYGYDLG